MWASTHDTLVGYKSEGSACKFADKKMGGLESVPQHSHWSALILNTDRRCFFSQPSRIIDFGHEVTAQTPYITAKNYCAVNRGLYGNGEA